MTNNQLLSRRQGEKQSFFGHGKILLTGEYFVLDGAKSIALPTSLGQSLSIHYAPSFQPKLHWTSFDNKGNIWLEAKFELWYFSILDNDKPSEQHLILQKILRQVRKQNIHFLRDEVDTFVETHLDFPLEWGLGSSSTLILNIAQWANISPFELFFNTYGGSGYDVACAQSEGPILYQRNSLRPQWSPLFFSPPFKDHLYFIYLGNKKNTQEAIRYYHSKRPFSPSVTATIGDITEKIIETKSLEKFKILINQHEDIVSHNLQLPKIKDTYFSDFPGPIKNLGAWEGDFILATSTLGQEKTKHYFERKGFPICFPYRELIFSGIKGRVKYPNLAQRHNDFIH